MNKKKILLITVISTLLALQTVSLQRLEKENQEAARRLEEVVLQGEILLEKIQQALHEIAQLQLENQALESNLKET